ncbi:hypothetical protein CFB84_37975 [Burkholderia aenigmatica]|uniref:Uncharacterized protein n=1 Tax=Burkholderia aenigmatica TaxID=2015348 RepID=A0A228HUE4_9BURK|nr:hypothetical protein [Burkholderia aenigmatica]OXI33525.1 hypothetical protein CFB84_37975 [Burkholderia aenigmatica]
MSGHTTPLRGLIDKWMVSTPASPIRLTRPRLNFEKATPLRCVRAETLRETGVLAIVFFRHGDGSWNVFPPMLERPTMKALPAAW